MEAVEEFLFGAVLVAIILKVAIYDPLKEYIQNPVLILNKLIETTKTLSFRIFVLILVISLIAIWAIRKHKRLVREAIYETERKIKLEQEAKEAKEFLKIDLAYMDSDELIEFAEKSEELNFSEATLNRFDSRIENKINWARKAIPEKQYQEKMQRRHDEEKAIKQNIEDLKQKRYDEELKQSNKEDYILKKLKPDENLVFEADDLRPEEIQVLEKEGFKRTTEYDPIQEKTTTFLVKQILNHSPTHTFLVERIKQMLEQHIYSDNINTHDTKDADITFTINSTIYALEIETGTLLQKTKRLKQKINYLNNKYGINWYFVVSNRDLLKKYRKFGRVTSRVGVCKIIRKIADF